MCTGGPCGRRWPARCRRRGRRTRRGRGRRWVRYTQVIDGWLLADRDVPRKQRHTARRVWQRLAAEHGARVAEVTVSRYVARRRAELGLDKMQVMVPQAHAPGAEAEVDFGEFHAVIAGVLIKLWMFVMRLSCSGRAFHVAFATQAQEAFLEGHVLAFEYFGAVPGRVRYDNLKPAVVRVLRGRDRAESERFIALRSHYGYDSFFCIPGNGGAHEKGGVEGEIGRFRRRHLVPVPAVASLAALNQLISAGDMVDDGRVITGRAVTIAAAFAAEQPAMGPLPADAVRPGAAAAGPGGCPGPGVRAAELLLRPGPLCRAAAAGAAVGQQRGGARRAAGGGPARTRRREVRRDPGPGPLPGGPAAQARCAARSHGAGPGPGGRDLHRRPPGGTGTPPAASTATQPGPAP